MEKDEKLLACFREEIEAIQTEQITACKQELAAIQTRLEQELREDAQAKAAQWYEQEAAELTARHAIEMSRLKDENHRKLMKERALLVDTLFEEVKQRLNAYRKTSAYLETLKQRLQPYAQIKDALILQVGACDEALLDELLKELGPKAHGEVSAQITLGGFRLINPAKAQMSDESYDSVLAEAKEQFLLTSGLTIA